MIEFRRSSRSKEDGGMKNRTLFLISLVLLCCLAAAIVAAARTSAQRDPVEERIALLEEQVTDLQARVAKLEKQLTARFVPVKGEDQKTKPSIVPWRALRKGMNRDEVKKLLGEPKDIMKFNENVVWGYVCGGSIRVDRSGRVEGWYEPR